MTVAKTSASFIRDLQFDDLSLKVRRTVQWALTDYVGVTIGGSNMPAAKILGGIQVGSSGSARVKVFGTDRRLTVPEAVLLNGTASHALDYDDVSWTTIGHPTVTVAPVIFAYGEVLGKNVTPLGELVVVQVQEKMSIAKPIGKISNIEIEDKVVVK